MLEGDFFNIIKIDATGENIEAELEIDPEHKIFEGHFPGQPVVPGVCMLQIIKEIVEEYLGKPTQIKKAGNLKFLTVINPTDNNFIYADIKYKKEGENNINIKASLYNDGVIYFKMQAELLILNGKL